MRFGSGGAKYIMEGSIGTRTYHYKYYQQAT